MDVERAAPSVAFLIGSLDADGGAQRQLVQLAAGLARRRWRVRVIVFYPNGGRERELLDAGVSVECLYKKRRWELPRFLIRLGRELRRDPPDVLQTMLVPPNIAAALLTPWLGNTALVWGVRESGADVRSYDRTRRSLWRLESRLSRRPALILCNAEAGRAAAAARGFPPDRLAVVPNGIDTSRFRPDRDGGKELRERWLGAADGPLVGLVARLDPKKDHIGFLHAARRFLDCRAGARFVCVGDGPADYTALLRRASRKLGLDDCVRWEQPGTDMAAAYNAFDMATLASSFGEGFPNVVGEAMACALPLVATDVGDCASIVGTEGIVVPVRDPEALAAGWEGIAAMTDADRQAMGERARSRIADLYSVDEMVARTAGHYAALAST